MGIQSKLLLAFARDPDEPEIGSTATYTLENCLDFPKKVIPSFDDYIRGRNVLDHGCGYGFQSVAMCKLLGAGSVFGVDAVAENLEASRRLAQENGVAERASFGPTVPAERQGTFDVVLSLSAFEHYSDPAGELRMMKDQLKPGGVVLLAWAEPWYSHSGSHFNNYTRLPFTNYPLPWISLFFSDEAMLRLRERFRADRPQRIEDISGGLNRMTLARFEKIVNESGMKPLFLRHYSTKGLPLVADIPLVRELLVSSSCVILQK
jgi:2-polyprenyl-3-methyl-5-hydroxy-6-metoxy-1,4-benzoquinol methylase